MNESNSTKVINEDGTAYDGRRGPLYVAAAFTTFLVIVAFSKLVGG